jgi:hypothetical protein
MVTTAQPIWTRAHMRSRRCQAARIQRPRLPMVFPILSSWEDRRRKTNTKSLISLAGVEGLEPPTPGFGDRCSSQLSYTPKPCGTATSCICVRDALRVLLPLCYRTLQTVTWRGSCLWPRPARRQPWPPLPPACSASGGCRCPSSPRCWSARTAPGRSSGGCSAREGGWRDYGPPPAQNAPATRPESKKGRPSGAQQVRHYGGAGRLSAAMRPRSGGLRDASRGSAVVPHGGPRAANDRQWRAAGDWMAGLKPGRYRLGTETRAVTAVRGTSAAPPILTVIADIRDRQSQANICPSRCNKTSAWPLPPAPEFLGAFQKAEVKKWGHDVSHHRGTQDFPAQGEPCPTRAKATSQGIVGLRLAAEKDSWSTERTRF